jgi:hypothetical protein
MLYAYIIALLPSMGESIQHAESGDINT